MKSQQERIDEILSVLLEYTVKDFSREIPFTEDRDELDAIGIGINSVGQELNHSLRELTRKNSELEEKQRLMELKNQELEQIAFITAHDLREPLVLIKSFAEKLKEDYGGKLDDTADLYIDFIYNSSTRLNQLMEGLLQYTRIGKERVAKTVNLNHVLSTVLAHKKEKMDELGAVVQTEELPVIKADIDEMNLLYTHLLSNALKFHHPQRTPHIWIKATSHNEFWQFSVSDNGMGIESQYLEKVFQMFRQLNPRENYRGVGLGLSYCRKVVEKYGGKIWVESSLGEGSTFYFTLPKNDSE